MCCHVEVREQFSPSTLWGPGIELKSSGLAQVLYLLSHLTSHILLLLKQRLVSMKGEKKLSLLITTTASEQDVTHLLNDTGHSGRYINKNKCRRAEALSLWCLEYSELSRSELYLLGIQVSGFLSYPGQVKSGPSLSSLRKNCTWISYTLLAPL